MPPPSTLDMLIPANAVGKVLGKGGANIANIRKVGSLNLEYFSRLLYARTINFFLLCLYL
jgi:hypothetical protein